MPSKPPRFQMISAIVTRMREVWSLNAAQVKSSLLLQTVRNCFEA